MDITLLAYSRHCWMATGPQLAHGLVATTVCSLALAVRVRVTLQLAIYRQSVRFGAKPLEDHDQRFLFCN
jgi:hypothetical protein